jgi:hypothetical protein
MERNSKRLKNNTPLLLMHKKWLSPSSPSPPPLSPPLLPLYLFLPPPPFLIPSLILSLSPFTLVASVSYKVVLGQLAFGKRVPEPVQSGPCPWWPSSSLPPPKVEGDRHDDSRDPTLEQSATQSGKIMIRVSIYHMYKGHSTYMYMYVSHGCSTHLNQVPVTCISTRA